MNNDYTFNQFIQAAVGADQAQSSPVFYQPPPQLATGMALSPFAPTFTPGIPPPNMNSTHNRGGFNQQWTSFPQEFYQSNPPPANDHVGEHHNFGVAQAESRVSHDFVGQPNSQGFQDFAAFQQHPAQKGNQQYQYYGGPRGRGRGQWGQRGRGRGSQDQFRYQMASRGHHSSPQQFTNSAGQRARQQQSRVNERHSRNDYGDPLYSHADLDNSNHRNSDNRPHDSQVQNYVGNTSTRNMYVRKVDQYNGRLNGSLQNPPKNNYYSSYSARGGRGGYRRDPNERSLQDNAGLASGSSHLHHDSRNRNSARSAPPGKRRTSKSDADADDQAEEGGNRRGNDIHSVSRQSYYSVKLIKHTSAPPPPQKKKNPVHCV